MKAQLTKAGVAYAVFDKIMENPVKEVIMEGAAFARANGCDFILALGGGAVLDSSKAIAAMATNDGDLWDYVNGGTGKGSRLQTKDCPSSPFQPRRARARRSTAGALSPT